MITAWSKVVDVYDWFADAHHVLAEKSPRLTLAGWASAIAAVWWFL